MREKVLVKKHEKIVMGSQRQSSAWKGVVRLGHVLPVFVAWTSIWTTSQLNDVCPRERLKRLQVSVVSCVSGSDGERMCLHDSRD